MIDENASMFGVAPVAFSFFSSKLYFLLLLCAVYAYKTYCTLTPPPSGDAAAAAMLPSWCLQTVPSIYGYVQATYWDVGFLRFYRHINRVWYPTN